MAALTDKCTRCGKLIEDEDSMIVLNMDDREFRRKLAAGEIDPAHLPPVREHYCELCMAMIEEVHEAHDEAVAAFRAELDKGMP